MVTLTATLPATGGTSSTDFYYEIIMDDFSWEIFSDYGPGPFGTLISADSSTMVLSFEIPVDFFDPSRPNATTGNYLILGRLNNVEYSADQPWDWQGVPPPPIIPGYKLRVGELPFRRIRHKAIS